MGEICIIINILVFDVKMNGLFLYIVLLLYNGVSGVDGESVSVIEGESVTLNIDVTTNLIKWYFNNTRIAQITGDQSKICTDDQCDERFRDRLKLDHQTGSLTIMNTRITDSGEYKAVIRRISSSPKIFRVFVFESDLSSGAVRGIIAAVGVAVVGVAVVVAVAVAVAVVIYCRKRKERNTETKPQSKIKEEKVEAGRLMEKTANGTISNRTESDQQTPL